MVLIKSVFIYIRWHQANTNTKHHSRTVGCRAMISKVGWKKIPMMLTVLDAKFVQKHFLLQTQGGGGGGARTWYPTYRILSANFKKLQLKPPPHTVSTQCTNCIFTYHLLIPPILRLVQDVCGFCGRRGCENILVKSSKKGTKDFFKIQSNCDYVVVWMKTPQFSTQNPCSNHLIRCSICKATIWTYNANHHYSDRHPEVETPTLVSEEEVKKMKPNNRK